MKESGDYIFQYKSWKIIWYFILFTNLSIKIKQIKLLLTQDKRYYKNWGKPYFKTVWP